MAEEALQYREAQEGGAAAAAATLPESHIFSNFRLGQGQLFWASPLSVAFVNLKPLVPGHVLVTPRRVVARMAGLSPEEEEDLWRSVRVVQSIVGGVHGAEDFDLGIQDGPVAGQSVPHVHVHVLPR